MRFLLILLCAMSITACSCQREVATDQVAIGGSTSRPSDRATTGVDPAAEARIAQQREQRREAISEAVGTLHRYLGELNGLDRANADRHWAYRRLPSDREEAGLRSIDNLSSIRIQNRAPVQLDEDPVPKSLQIPVELIAVLNDGQVLRFTGWYRLRRNPVEPRWEITGTSLQPVLR